MEARAEVASRLPDIPGNSTRRRDFCVMSGHVEINTWEPARLPVMTTDIFEHVDRVPVVVLPAELRLLLGVAPLVDVRWDNEWWTTTWHRWRCAHRQREYGTVGVGEVHNQAYNNDFPIDTHRVWVSHIAQLHHDDYSGRIWYRGYGWHCRRGHQEHARVRHQHRHQLDGQQLLLRGGSMKTPAIVLIALLALLWAAPAAGQVAMLSASTTALWLDRFDASNDKAPPPLSEPSSLGSAHHPVLAVVWRGEPGWMFREKQPAERTLVFGDMLSFQGGSHVRSTGLTQGGIELEISHDSRTGVVRVNGVKVDLSDSDNVILVDDVDGSERVVETLRIDGTDGEWIETFLGRSPVVREFVRCEVQLPDGALDGNWPFRDSIQRSLDDRCALMKAE